MKKIFNLTFADFKPIFRDSTLRTFLALPTLIFVLIVWGVPYLIQEFDILEPYVPIMLVVCVIENTQMFSFISGMVLIDEKGNNVAKVYGIVPLSRFQYIVSRFLFPYIFTVILNVILFIVQPFYTISLLDNLLISFLAGLVVPLYAMALNTIAENRMKGLVCIKALNLLVLLPVAAFFVPEKFVHAFGVFPTHWVFQGIDKITQGLSAGLMSGIGFIVFGVLLWLISKLFIQRHFV